MLNSRESPKADHLLGLAGLCSRQDSKWGIRQVIAVESRQSVQTNEAFVVVYEDSASIWASGELKTLPQFRLREEQGLTELDASAILGLVAGRFYLTTNWFSG